MLLLEINQIVYLINNYLFRHFVFYLGNILIHAITRNIYK